MGVRFLCLCGGTTVSVGRAGAAAQPRFSGLRPGAAALLHFSICSHPSRQQELTGIRDPSPQDGNLGCGWLLVVKVTQDTCQAVGWQGHAVGQEMGDTAWIPVSDHYRDKVTGAGTWDCLC